MPRRHLRRRAGFAKIRAELKLPESFPDPRTPLHPPSLSEGAASLLAGELRRALLWTIDRRPAVR